MKAATRIVHIFIVRDAEVKADVPAFMEGLNFGFGS